jgi:hypothetical protein
MNRFGIEAPLAVGVDHGGDDQDLHVEVSSASRGSKGAIPLIKQAGKPSTSVVRGLGAKRGQASPRTASRRRSAAWALGVSQSWFTSGKGGVPPRSARRERARRRGARRHLPHRSGAGGTRAAIRGQAGKWAVPRTRSPNRQPRPNRTLDGGAGYR